MQIEDKDGIYSMEKDKNGVVKAITLIPSASRQMFVGNECRDVTLDGSFSSMEKLAILLAVMRDGNCHLQIIGVRFCEGETKKNYRILLEGLQKCVFQDEEPVLFGDRGKPLIGAIQEVYGSEKKLNSCVVHMKRNADDKGVKLGESLTIRKRTGHLISKAAYAANAVTFKMALERMNYLSDTLHSYVSGAEEVWYNLAATEETLGFRTSNNAESCFSVMKRSPKDGDALLSLNIYKLVLQCLVMIKTQYDTRYCDVLEQLKCCPYKSIITRAAWEKCKTVSSMEEKCRGQLSIVDVDGVTKVKDANGNLYSIDFQKHYCSCQKYQLYGIPCVHAIFLLRNKGYSFSQAQTGLVHPHFTTDVVLKTIVNKFPFIEDTSFEEFEKLKEMITGTEEVPKEFGPYCNELWKFFNRKGVYVEVDDDTEPEDEDAEDAEDASVLPNAQSVRASDHIDDADAIRPLSAASSDNCSSQPSVMSEEPAENPPTKDLPSPKTRVRRSRGSSFKQKELNREMATSFLRKPIPKRRRGASENMDRHLKRKNVKE